MSVSEWCVCLCGVCSCVSLCVHTQMCACSGSVISGWQYFMTLSHPPAFTFFCPILCHGSWAFRDDGADLGPTSFRYRMKRSSVTYSQHFDQTGVSINCHPVKWSKRAAHVWVPHK